MRVDGKAQKLNFRYADFESLPHTMHKIKSRMLHDIGLSNDFQDMTSKAQTTKEKNRKVFKNFKKFVPQRTLSAKWKINSQYERR
jgi:hypothetical protein